MTTSNISERKPREIDPSLYRLEGEELAFFQKETGIEDEDKLKQHILRVQEKAYKVYSYPCIRRFAFLSLKISQIPGYEEMLNIAKTQKDPLLLDIGCCFGNDLRKGVADGWPVQLAIGSDLRADFWDYGHELFNTTPDSYPAKFLAGDVFDPAFIAPPYEPLPTNANFTQSRRLQFDAENQSFIPLRGSIAAIHSSSLFHLFDEEQQEKLVYILSSLFSPVPGSVILGRHIAAQQKGVRTEEGSSGNYSMFCHNPESWKELWHQVFKGRADIAVKADLMEIKRDDQLPAGVDDTRKHWLMRWIVKRL